MDARAPRAEQDERGTIMAVAKPAPKPEEGWHRARLIPTTGIGGQDEQEQRATSSLLAVMRAVPEFGKAILAHLDAPAGRIDTFSEVRFLDAEGNTVVPDGAVVVERGKTRWIGLVEVKTGALRCGRSRSRSTSMSPRPTASRLS